MWYEIIPSLGIVTVLLLIPPVAQTGINWLCFNGKTMARRWHDHPEDFQAYLRDRRLTGSEYVPKGLEALPEEK